jgi:5-methyltetrahydrofolate--homocysteine methyltransferase
MSGLELANQIVDPERRARLAERLQRETEQMLASRPAAQPAAAPVDRRPAIRRDFEIPLPPDLKRHVLADYDLSEIFTYINPAMLYSRHLGLRDAERALGRGEPRALELRRAVEAVEAAIIAHPEIRASAVYRFFPANSDGGRVTIYDADGARMLERFDFPRQSAPPGLCLADYVAPRDAGRLDYLCMFVTTIGPGVRALAESWQREGEYLRSHLLQAIALEAAEAFAELLHRKLRAMWGFGDPPGLTLKDLFRARYRGKRYSFGYPACPRLEDQAKLFRLLDAERAIGVRLTEGFMMEPEGSVSALVLHHPEARYFSVAESDGEPAGEAAAS